jgi:3-oxoacyl-[acyl-carrier-protein] synthase II
MAIEDSGLNLEQEDKDRIGAIVGSGIGGMFVYEQQQQSLFERGKPDRISPYFIPR